MNEELQGIFEEVQAIYQLKEEQGDAMSQFEMRNIMAEAYRLRTFARKTLTEHGQEILNQRMS